jgi:glucosylglycerate synthase
LDLNVHQASFVGDARAPGRQSTLLPDAFVHDLMAAGQADILVGIPTLNHAQTAGQVARTVHELFTTVFARERTVLLNPDGGSTDGTQAAIAGSGAPSSELLVTSFSLRTLHRITTPYHGVPGRGSAMRLIFAAADLLNVRAVAVISPESTDLTVKDLAQLLAPVLESAADYVKPVVPRAPEEGPLVTQLVRPLLGAVFGARLLEPIDPLLACSRAFARRALQSELWDSEFAQYGLDPWLGALAVLEGFRLAQVRVHPQRSSAHSRPDFSEVFQQVVGSVFSVITRESQRWLPLSGVREIAVSGEPIAAAASTAHFDAGAYAHALRDGVDALGPVLADVLRRDTLAALQSAARGEAPRIDDALWVRTVYDVLASAGRGTLPLSQLVQALQPIYLGRLSTLLNELAAEPRAVHEEPHSRLARAFEQLKPELVAAWPVSHAGGET